VRPTFWKNPVLVPRPWLLMNWMSSRSSVRHNAALQVAFAPTLPRAPASTVCAMTGRSGGSDRKLLGSLHGAAGSAQVNSIAVGARMPSL
jgi:hypothetical protein